MTREQFITEVEGTQGALRRFLVALSCGDSALADDLAQEAYIKAYLSLDALGDASKFRPWIYRIAYNTFLNHRRSAVDFADYEEAKLTPSYDTADGGFKYQALYQALSRLPDKERTSVLLYYMEGYSIKEIAELEHLSVDAVKQHLSRGRKHLNKLIHG